MGGVPAESKLFHAIVVMGLSFASTACGGTTRGPLDGDAGGDAGPLLDAGPLGFGPGPGDAAGSDVTQPPQCVPDAGKPDGSDCVWPIYI